MRHRRQSETRRLRSACTVGLVATMSLPLGIWRCGIKCGIGGGVAAADASRGFELLARMTTTFALVA